MTQTYIRDVSMHDGEEITIKGWLYNMRSSGKLMFPQIRDGSGIIQGVVFKKNVPEQVWNDFESLTQESSIIVNGKVRADERERHPHLHPPDFWLVSLNGRRPL